MEFVSRRGLDTVQYLILHNQYHSLEYGTEIKIPGGLLVRRGLKNIFGFSHQSDLGWGNQGDLCERKIGRQNGIYFLPARPPNSFRRVKRYPNFVTNLGWISHPGWRKVGLDG